MPGLFNALREHRHFFIIATLLILATTFPTIVYVFKTDIYWHPASNSNDVYIHFWDVWYGGQFLAGQADSFYTGLLFYPEGLSLVSHPFNIPHIIAVNAFSLFLPVFNAFSLAYLLNIFVCALFAYVYLVWLFKDKWIATFGAIVFGLGPHVVGHPNHPPIAHIAPIPLAVYCAHRGLTESRRLLVVCAGLLAGLTTVVILYVFTCLMITLGFLVPALARARLREKHFWLNVALLILTISLSSLWRIYPLVTGIDSVVEVAKWHGEGEIHTDAVSYFINHKNPVFDRWLNSAALLDKNKQFSATSYLGYLPLLLTGLGLLTIATRRKMEPWLLLCALFLILRLGSRLTVNGVVYSDIHLPKYYLNQLLPQVFSPFWEADHYMIGVLLPLAVLACYGLVALQQRFASLAKPGVVLALVAIVASEYHISVQTDRIFPIGDGAISDERLAFLDWLDQEDDEIRLINLPMGRVPSKIYNLYQSLSGFPHAEGAISRTPDRAFDYIRANSLLNAWHEQRPVSCEWIDRATYLAGLAQLETDGFSHVVYHREFADVNGIKDSFRDAEPAYADEFVQIFRLRELGGICTEALNAGYSFTWANLHALQMRSILDERHGTVLLFPPTAQAYANLQRYFRLFTEADRSLASIWVDEQSNIQTRHSAFLEAYSSNDLEQNATLWLVNSRQAINAEETPAFQGWFSQRFRFCQRYREDEHAVFDLYLRVDVPCSAVEQSSQMQVRFDSGLRLRQFSYALKENTLHFYLNWSNDNAVRYGFSLQFFDDQGQKTLQYDNVVQVRPLSTYEIDASSLPAGDYSIQLIVYDFETLASQGGTVTDTGERFDRALEIGSINWSP